METGSSGGYWNGDENGDGDGNESRLREARGEAKNARNRKIVEDAIRHFHFARVIISADRGWNGA